MKLKEVSVGKELKIGLPNYSNITVRCDLKFDVAEDEQVNWSTIWDEVNFQLSGQTNGTDPSWIETKEYTNFFKTTIKTTK